MNYILRLFSSGAIRKTPRQVLDAIAAEANSKSTANIIEVGAGYGEITGRVLEKIAAAPKLRYYAFEIDDRACMALQQTFSNIHVLNRSAFELEEALPASFKAAVFISSIPLSFYKHGVLKKFFATVKSRLEKEGKIILVFSAPWLIPFLRKQLPGLKIRSFATFPFYFVGVYTY